MRPRTLGGQAPARQEVEEDLGTLPSYYITPILHETRTTPCRVPPDTRRTLESGPIPTFPWAVFLESGVLARASGPEPFPITVPAGVARVDTCSFVGTNSRRPAALPTAVPCPLVKTSGPMRSAFSHMAARERGEASHQTHRLGVIGSHVGSLFQALHGAHECKSGAVTKDEKDLSLYQCT